MLIDKLNNEKEKTVILTVINHKTYEVSDIKIIKTLLMPNPITSEFENNILFIMIYGFNKATVGAVSDVITKTLNDSQIKGIIIDLRGNLGGLFDQAIETADLFIDDGIIVSTKGRHADSFQYYEAKKDVIISKDIPMLVMIDGKTASSAEILASALQDSGRAVILGTTSYGKNSIQTVVLLPDNNLLFAHILWLFKSIVNL